jgi:hypothetical protein
LYADAGLPASCVSAKTSAGDRGLKYDLDLSGPTVDDDAGSQSDRYLIKPMFRAVVAGTTPENSDSYSDDNLLVLGTPLSGTWLSSVVQERQQGAKGEIANDDSIASDFLDSVVVHNSTRIFNGKLVQATSVYAR